VNQPKSTSSGSPQIIDTKERALEMLTRASYATSKKELITKLSGAIQIITENDLDHDKSFIESIKSANGTRHIISKLRKYLEKEELAQPDAIVAAQFLKLVKVDSREDAELIKKIQSLILRRCSDNQDASFELSGSTLKVQTSILFALSNWRVGDAAQLKAFSKDLCRQRSGDTATLKYDALLLRSIAAIPGWPKERFEILKPVIQSRTPGSLYDNLTQALTIEPTATTPSDRNPTFRKALLYVSDVIYSLSKSGVYDPAIYDLCRDFLATNLSHLSARDLAIAAWSFSHCYIIKDGKNKEFINKVGREVSNRISAGRINEFNDKDCCHLAWGLAIGDAATNKDTISTIARRFYSLTDYRRQEPTTISEKEVAIALVVSNLMPPAQLPPNPIFGSIKFHTGAEEHKKFESDVIAAFKRLEGVKGDPKDRRLPAEFQIRYEDTSKGIYKDILIENRNTGEKVAFTIIQPEYRHFNGDSNEPIYATCILNVGVLQKLGFKVFPITLKGWEAFQSSENPDKAFGSAVLSKLGR
jgi:hypothetical protein